jgi:voltage-gated potassium channel
MYNRLKVRIYQIVEKADEGDNASKVFDIFIMAMIVVNIVAVMLETVHSLFELHSYFFHAFDILSVAVFTIEYFLRLWSVTSSPRYRHPVTGRLRFAWTPMALIDLMAILPFYLPFIVELDLRMMRALRLIRLFRVLKFGRYSQSLRLFGIVVRSKREELGIVLFMVLILLVVASTLMYFVEHEKQPDVFSSIPAAMWWGVMTLTTVGYGDVYPVTSLGKFFGTIIAILGIGLFALPAAILSSGFVVSMQEREGKACPHCGKLTEEPVRTRQEDQSQTGVYERRHVDRSTDPNEEGGR